ncbi:glycosyltransferase family A protein [Clostridium sp. LIBA-8841]|uniref:glycosyltransferase family 2 protein n=1 Tax=Clostridium sp. LIBA-8841 TaxID=2987530 RepID=UPI002AC74199|nr:glycosyltransferase family A protein [Clostridium sp. LIBA-8841]MDZ5254383.1 glycosyltransferase family 2 protein [Clostridium sp. LIBA-8841]
MEKLLTVFTPSYNRAYILHKCYESLKKQSCKDFKWLIVDDGSTDNTKELVEMWKNENNGFEINYIYQNNQGMHGAHNTAYENIDTELNVCIDSDDYMPKDAVKKIKKSWNRVKHNKKIAGLAGLDAYESGDIIGGSFPEELKESTLFEINNKYKIPGDKKLVYRSELTKKFPYPIFEGEKYVGLAYKYYKLDEEYRLALTNDVLCIVEYLEDGSSKNMIKQYKKNPKGFAFYRVENIKNSRATLKFKFKESVHYVSSSFLSRNKNFLKESPYKILTLLSIPLGASLYLYIKKND